MKIASIIGARPQFVKAAVVSRLISLDSEINEIIIHTGQHFDSNMSNIFFDELEIPKPDVNLGIGGGSHGQNTGKMVEQIENILIIEKPDWIIVYGDTDSTLAGAIAAVKLNIPIAHVEAGLRSYNRSMPEEINRVLTDHISSILFVPTNNSIINLKKEGNFRKKVINVGDVMLDAVNYYKAYAKEPKILNFSSNTSFVLCTIHRAENTDNKIRLENIVKTLNKLSKHIKIVLPLHPRTRKKLSNYGGENLNSSIELIDPVGYLEMNWLISNCQLVITDSGGLQKESYFHKKPCVTLRNETEWIELLEDGANILLDPSKKNSLSIILQMMNKKVNPNSELFGDGNAGKLIIEAITNFKHLL